MAITRLVSVRASSRDFPFKSVVMYSSENAGGFLDFNAELQLWTRAGMFKLNLNKGVDIRELDRLIASCIL